MQKTISRDRHKMADFVRFKRVVYPDISDIQLRKKDPEDNKESLDDKKLDGESDVSSSDAGKGYQYDHSGETYLAWFEPDQLIVRSKVPFFVNRFHSMRWSILTPDVCAHWNLKQLYFTEGLAKRPNIEDGLDGLWLTYYRHIFNPARLKLKAMPSEMPKKYWANLPEAVLIPELTRNAQSQTETMID
ncbi:MAG: hypothetical protein ACI82Z_000395 [Cellvibrionaceae bacterium]|jgi:hypothetical protein